MARLCPATFATLACAVLAGCGSEDDPKLVAPTGSYTLDVSPTVLSTTLGKPITFSVTLTTDDYTGPVFLTTSNVPSTWNVDYIGGTAVQISPGGLASVSIAVQIPPNAEPAPAGQTLRIHGSSWVGDQSDSIVVTVANEFIIPMGLGTGSGPHWGLMAGQTLELHAGTTLTFFNNDSTGHRIHSDDDIPGFLHQDATMGPGGHYSCVLGAGSGSVYCHDHLATTGTFSLVVE